ncbi:hypothetical protein ATCC90586_011761 [Pythium insidiosum]|nr:hypothetical protein ATCC90586_011761 [Pythium insidiosum]
MRAHIGREVKAHCGKRQIGMCVIPGGLTPYLQAGDIGIYKSFKDKMGSLVDAWKRSDQVEYTRGGNPKPPSISVVTGWIRQAWQAVPQSVVDLSIARAGFSTQLDEWHIARHDVYGEQFHKAWSQDAEPPADANMSEDDHEGILCDALDDISLIEP